MRPVRRTCAEVALDLGVTDGVWAGVRLPGTRFPEDLDEKRATLRRVIDGMAREPEAHRRRTRAIRAAMHHQFHLAAASAGA